MHASMRFLEIWSTIKAYYKISMIHFCNNKVEKSWVTVNI